VLKEGETDEEAVLMSFSHLMSTWRRRVQISRNHERWVGPVRRRSQSLDEAIRQPERKSQLGGLEI
jgi:hypothetical protein